MVTHVQSVKLNDVIFIFGWTICLKSTTKYSFAGMTYFEGQNPETSILALLL